MAYQTVRHGQPATFDACLTRDEPPTGDCPVEFTVAVLRGRWTPLVLAEFFRHGERGYAELATALCTISDKVLSERLEQLTRAGILAKNRTAAWPPRVRYTLTDRGDELRPVVEAMWSWGARHGW